MSRKIFMVLPLATLASSSQDRGKEAEIHKRLRMRNTGERRSLLIPVRARVGKRSRMRPRILLTYL